LFWVQKMSPNKKNQRDQRGRCEDRIATGDRLTQRWALWAFLIVLLSLAALRYRLRGIPLERDEGEYAYAGQLMLQGIPPYKLAYNMKLPGTYAAYALIITIFGQSASGIHTGFLLMNAGTSILVFLLARRLFDSPADAVAGMAFSVLSASTAVFGLAAHATQFVIAAAVGGLLLLLHAMELERLAFYFCSGTCLGVAFLMKQPGFAFSAFALGYFVYQKRSSWTNWHFLAPRGGLLLLGMVWPFGLTCLILDWAGVFHDFWFWTFTYAREYATSQTLSEGMHNIDGNRLLHFDAALWMFAGWGLVTVFLNRKSRAHAVFLPGLLLFCFLGVAASLHFRAHYFVLLLPALALLCAAAVSNTPAIFGQQWMAAAAFIIALVACVIEQGPILFAPNADEACWRLYPENPFREAAGIAKYIETQTSPTDRIVVFGSEPEIYFYSRRHSATGYIYMYPLMEDQPYSAQMQRQLMDEVTRNRPEYVVMVDDQLSWLWRPGLEPFFTGILEYIDSAYTQTASVEIGGEPSHVLSDSARLYVFRRQEQ
jgi:hypothetical protein